MPSGTQSAIGGLTDSGPKEIDLLYRISELVPSVNGSTERFLRVMEILDRAFGIGYGALTLVNPSRGEALLEVAFGHPNGEPGSGQCLDSAIVKEVLTCAQPMAFNRITQKPFTPPSKSLREKELSLVCVPIMRKTVPVGVISTNPIYRDTVSFGKDIRLLKLISCMVFHDVALLEDEDVSSEEFKGDSGLDKILEGKLRKMIEKIDLGTESRCALLSDIVSLVEKIVIKWALRRHHDVQTTTARFLGINRNTLRKKMKDLKIHFQKP